MQRTLYQNQLSDSGFTVVEMVVTMVILALFLGGFLQSYLLVDSQRVKLAQQSRASDVAYSNLRKFASRPSGLTCTAAMDLIANANAPGVLLGDQNNTVTSSAYGFIAEPTSVTQSLGSGATQEVRAFAPDGCANFATNPVKITSVVTYGSSGDKVQHASFVN